MCQCWQDQISNFCNIVRTVVLWVINPNISSVLYFEKMQNLIPNFYATLLWQCHCLPSVSNDSVTAVNYERTIVALMSNKAKKQHRQNLNSKILNSKEDYCGKILRVWHIFFFEQRKETENSCLPLSMKNFIILNWILTKQWCWV